MSRWLFVTPHLLMEAQTARRDARIRFLLAQVRILRGKLPGNRVIVSPEHRTALVAIGQELSHGVKNIIGIVTPQTYARFYNRHRPHQGVGSRTLPTALGNDPPLPEQCEADPIRCEPFLGGLLRHYYHAAA